MKNYENEQLDIYQLSEKYKVSEQVITNYIESIQLNDTEHLEIYNLIINETCPHHLQSHFKTDVKKIITQNKKSKK